MTFKDYIKESEPSFLKNKAGLRVLKKMNPDEKIVVVGYYNVSGDWQRWTTFKGTVTDVMDDIKFENREKKGLKWVFDK